MRRGPDGDWDLAAGLGRPPVRPVPVPANDDGSDNPVRPPPDAAAIRQPTQPPSWRLALPPPRRQNGLPGDGRHAPRRFVPWLRAPFPQHLKWKLYLRLLWSRRSVERLALTMSILAAIDRSWGAGGGVTANPAGLALRGCDPVAFFELGRSTTGDPALSTMHRGAIYRFVSPRHREAFVARPEAYAPQYGGLCAMGAAIGQRLDGDPALWRIVDGRLYLHANAQAQQAWLRDIAGNIARADLTWARSQGRPAAAV